MNKQLRRGVATLSRVRRVHAVSLSGRVVTNLDIEDMRWTWPETDAVLPPSRGRSTKALKTLLLGSIMLASAGAACAVERFVSPSGGHQPPFTNWADAATNIQAAIDAAAVGDVIWVTNGIYDTGGKVMAGDLANRVALDKALSVQSVNGPFVTTIQGGGVSPGTAAVRCAWLTNGATLSGFTLRGGATRAAGDFITLQSGGGGWCASTNAAIANCLIVSNVAAAYGGGVYGGTLNNCLLTGNKAGSGGGGYVVLLNNCTVTSNSGGGFYGGAALNSILYFNSNYNWAAGSGSPQAYCCTTPLPSGAGNISANPQLLDGIHLANSSPCRGAGTNRTVGVDIYGQAWANPPAMGCAEWQAFPWASRPRIQLTTTPPGFAISAAIAGQEPLACYWMRDGVPIEAGGHFVGTWTTNLVAVGVDPLDGGNYQLVVSNASGMVTSQVAQVVLHCVDAAATNAIPPYTTWTTAATNIQDAIDAALPGEIVCVTNGLYTAGGKVKGGDLTNRVALDKAILVQSVNGPAATIMQGSGPIGSAAVRCAWVTNGAILSGFTLRGGATRSLSPPFPNENNGGGVWGASTNATVFNCLIVNNQASHQGGGACQVTLNRCTLQGNQAVGSGVPGAGWAGDGTGGGAALCNLQNCVVVSNTAAQTEGGGATSCNLRNCLLTGNVSYLNGGAAESGTLVNCTISGNWSGGYSWSSGAAVHLATLTNCIVIGNRPPSYVPYPDYPDTNYQSCTLSYCCTVPLASGVGNIDADPQLLSDGAHLTSGSPCRGAGTNIAQGTDLDGQPWASPPPIGCDEWWPEPVIGTQPRRVFAAQTDTIGFALVVAGQPPFAFWWSKDGTLLREGAHYHSANTTNLVVRGLGLEDAGGYQVVASNAFGVVTSQVAQLVLHCVDVAGSNPSPPYTTWQTAATSIQDAVDAAAAGEVVLVTNGVYASGGRVMEGGLSNRVVLDKALTVLSVNGAVVTTIRGQWDPVSTNGPAAARCVWLTNGAVLNGFTITGGATRAVNAGFSGGGGVLGYSGSLVVNCLVTSNTAAFGGGGCYGGHLLNCAIVGNRAPADGAGAWKSELVNCTVTGNGYGGGGAYDSHVTNCIVYFNWATFSTSPDLMGNISAAFSCSPRLAGQGGNIATDPQLVDAFHLAVTSPCRGMGSSLYAAGTDLDGDDWLNPPSMGCDEVMESATLGPLAVAVEAAQTNVLVNHAVALTGRITGRAARLEWDFGEGFTVTNASYITLHAWTNAGDYAVTFTAFNADNPAGVTANLVVRVLPIVQPVLSLNGPPGTNFQFQFMGQVDANYWVEYATNLTPQVSWQTLKSLTSTGGVIQIIDALAANSARFYRVRAQ